MNNKKVESIQCKTPFGRLSFPYLDKPDVGRTYSNGKYKSDLFISKQDMNSPEGKQMVEAVLKVAREYFQNPSITLQQFKHPFKDVDAMAEESRLKLPEAVRTGHILIRCNSKNQPPVLGPDKKELTAEEVSKVKGGDWARFVVGAFPYHQQGGGVTFGLNVVQFKQKGEAFGQGVATSINMLDEIEVTPDDLDVSSDTPDTDVPGVTSESSLFG
jgi:hypothetical protein